MYLENSNQTTSNRTQKDIASQMHYMVQSFHIITDEITTYREMYEPLYSCIHNGFIFMEDGEILKDVPKTLFDVVKNAIGMSCGNTNKTFHKSFEKVETAEINELITEQLIHYFSTYGLESIGLDAHPIIPAEELELPVFTPKKIIVVQVVSPDEATIVVNNYYKKMKQPSVNARWTYEKLCDNYCTLAPEEIASFEIQVIAYQRSHTVPKNPTSFLRYLVYLVTCRTMLVNSPRFATQLKDYARWSQYRDEVKDYFAQADLTKLASIFFRNKNIFLAFKAYPGCAPYINKIRRLADKYHKPLSNKSIQTFTKMLAENASWKDIMDVINSCDIFDAVKLLNIVYRKTMITSPETAVFNIRTGTSFVKEGGVKPADNMRKYTDAAMALADHIKNLCDLEGKVFYIPDFIEYGFPTSQKQMIGAIPWGTRVFFNCDKAITMGIYWENQNKERVDLDLHMHGANKTFGWNGYYRGRSEVDEVLFTGDQTDATNGAAEAFYFKPGEETYMVDVAQFAGPHDTPFFFFMSEVKPEDKKEKYTFNPENAMLPMIPVAMDSRDTHVNSLGYVHGGDYGEFVFTGGAVSSNIGAHSKYYEQFIEATQSRYDDAATLVQIIGYCGGKVIDTLPEPDEDGNMPEFISLAPEDLSLDTILNIFTQE